jgi:bacterial/archaeal transporter family-2 protein
MILAVLMATAAGVLIGLSRQLNGRLALETSALTASGVNHVVGFAVLVLAGLALGLLRLESAPPWWAWAGGPLGVLFVAMGSWLVARLGAAATALLTIAGQMLAGALLDTLRGAEGIGLRLLGVALILAGVALSRR